MNEWSDEHDRVREPSRRRLLSPTVPPQWQSDTPVRESCRPRHNDAAFRYQASSGPPASSEPQAPSRPQVSADQHRPGQRIRKRNTLVLATAGIAAVGFISGALGSDGGRSLLEAAVSSKTAPQLSAVTQTEKACSQRSAVSGGIYVRTIKHGVPPRARRMDARWGWGYLANRCLTSVQMAIATAPQAAGDCTQVGYVDRNPGYDVKARSAPPLPHVAAEAGSACKS